MLSEWLTFIASIIDALAWPSAIVIIVLSLRRAILRRIPGIRELEVGPVKIKLDEALEEVREKAKEVKTDLPALERPSAHSEAGKVEVEPVSLPPENAKSSSQIEELLLIGEELAKESPEAAILYTWVEVEDAFRRLSERHELNPRSPLSKNVDLLLRSKIITGEMVSLFKDLRSIRNAVAHKKSDVPPDINGAEDYIMSAATLIEAFK